jgi:hypothetical protein
LEINADPALLRERLPATWSARPEIAAAAALLLTLALPGCATPPAAKSRPGPQSPPAAPTSNGIALVAPLFEHGEGRSTMGCMVVAPPVFLSEEEAWEVIDAELARNGIHLPEKERIIPGVEVPLYPAAELEQLVEGDPLPTPSSIEPLRADRFNSRRKIALEFVSAENPPEKIQYWSLGSINGLELKGEAEVLREAISTRSSARIYFAALYDPVTYRELEPTGVPFPPEDATEADWEKFRSKANAPAKAESKRLLRLQVQDFIHWLEAQGAI